MKALFPILLIACLAACAANPTEQNPPSNTLDSAHAERLAEVLARQDTANQARYVYRNPYETLEFFGIAPGMTVVEWLPGQGWYSQILVPYLGDEGALIGLDYPLSMWPNFPFATEDFISQRREWPVTWPDEAAEWRDEQGARVLAYTMDAVPEQLNGSADAVLFIRAIHNLMRFEEQGEYLTDALALTHRLLKSGGVVGVVQHQAPEHKSAEWADGSRAYVKKSAVIEAFQSAGFEYVDAATINENPLDQPGADDHVWRLPPSLSVAQDDPELQAEYQAIGESNRMTLLFRKP